MDVLVFLPILVSFILTLIVMPFWIRKAKEIGLLGKDINKADKRKVAEAGGIVVILGFVIGVLIYIAVRTFIFGEVDEVSLKIFALSTSLLMLAFIGLVDSLFAASSNSAEHQHIKGWRRGIKKRYRLLLCLFAAVPLMVINAGVSLMNVPFFGAIDFGLLYPLFIIPIAMIGVSTTYNFLAGYNGLEAGQGIIVLGFLSFVAYITGNAWLSVVGLCMVVSLLAFFIFNWYPAKVFPSDVMTYPVGGLIVIMAILGNFEKIAFIVFIPYMIEVLLKSRGGLKKQSFGKPKRDGGLEMPYDKIYGMTHLAIFVLSKFKRKVREQDVVYFIFAIQILFVLIGFLML